MRSSAQRALLGARFQTVKKSFKNREKKLASPWPLPLDGKGERQTALFGRSKKVQKK
jgi:hypothetical protein